MIRALIQHLWSRYNQLIRFGIVGVLAVATHYAIYYMLNAVMDINLAYTIGYGISFVGNFILSNYFTFKTKPTTGRGVGFALSHLVNYGIQLGLLNLFVWMGLTKDWAAIPTFMIAIPINFMMVRFALNREWSFRSKSV